MNGVPALEGLIWAEASQHYHEPALAALIIASTMINVWNRIKYKEMGNLASRNIHPLTKLPDIYRSFSTIEMQSSSTSSATSACSLVTMSGGAMRMELWPAPR